MSAISKLEAATAEQFLERKYPTKEPLLDGLLHRRDMVAFGARRRHGKTTLLTNIAVALAANVDQFLGYKIPERRRSLLLMLEDDPGEYQGVLRGLAGERALEQHLRVLTREDFFNEDVPIDAKHPRFQDVVRYNAGLHAPDVIVFDNLAQIINAEYNDPTRVQALMKFCYELARGFDAAVILAAHPRKEGDEKLSLKDDPERFFEAIMGSSHFINSTGSLWGLERHDSQGYSVFLGGRQRGEGAHGVSHIRKGDSGWFELIDSAESNLRLVVHTPLRAGAWRALPGHPQTFGYREGQDIVKAAGMATGTYASWMKECRRLGVVISVGDKLSKLAGLPNEVQVWG